MQVQNFYSHGKLLLTGEYVVLDGAKALALPCKLGQTLKVKTHSGLSYQWISYLKNNQKWKSLSFDLEDIKNGRSKDPFALRLYQILKVIYEENPELFKSFYTFSTQLEFDKNWGLGSSSTLINNLSQWANIDPYFLLNKTFGGSGYDVAAAQFKTPFVYQRLENEVITESVEISEKLKPYLYFIYTNQKQDSREAIANYRKNLKSPYHTVIDQISNLTELISNADDLNDFEDHLKTHEVLISKLIGQIPIQESKFQDYKGGIVKSLGAWGGDFVLVTAKNDNDLIWFRKNGYPIIYKYEDLVY